LSVEKLASARECFQAGQAERGLVLVKEVCRNADSADIARQAFGLLQEQLAAVPARNLASTLAPLGEDPRISVIVPTKNRERMLGSALDSLASQSWGNWECILVNDGGTAVEPIVAASRARARIRLVSLAESLGQAAARNRAIDEASGQILCFLDDDDRFGPGHLAAIAKAMAGTSHAACYTRFETVLERVDESGRHELGRRLAYAPPRFSHPLLMVRSYMAPVSWGLRIECIHQAGGFDEVIPFMEDWELLLRLTQHWDMVQVESVAAEYRLREMQVEDSVSKRGKDPDATMRRIYARNSDGGDDLIAFARKLYLWLVVSGNFSVAASPRQASPHCLPNGYKAPAR